MHLLGNAAWFVSDWRQSPISIFRPSALAMIERQLLTEEWNRTIIANRELLDLVLTATKMDPKGWNLINCLDSLKVIGEIGYVSALNILHHSLSRYPLPPEINESILQKVYQLRNERLLFNFFASLASFWSLFIILLPYLFTFTVHCPRLVFLITFPLDTREFCDVAVGTLMSDLLFNIIPNDTIAFFSSFHTPQERAVEHLFPFNFLPLLSIFPLPPLLSFISSLSFVPSPLTRYRHFSAHDSTLVAFIGCAGIELTPENFPSYGSFIILETYPNDNDPTVCYSY